MITTKQIAELTGKRHDNILRDARKMFVELYGLGYPFRSELSAHEVFATITDPGWLPLADVLISNPIIVEYVIKTIKNEISILKSEVDSLNKKIRWRVKTCNELGVSSEEYDRCYFQSMQYTLDIEKHEKRIKELEEVIR